ncbi:MAG: hypothetical protein WDW36_006459 [Sanguina aurantia]
MLPSHTNTSAQSCWDAWQGMRQQRPLVQCITNVVSCDLMANTLLAAGASPAMAHSVEEVESFVCVSSALLINMGGLGSERIAAQKLAAAQAVRLSKPWVLDPVGCGATSYRTRCCAEMLLLHPSVVRGNAAEIMALSGNGAAGAGVGVDSLASSAQALASAKALARAASCVVAVSGATDYVTDGTAVVAVANGVALLPLVTATGCSVTALIAAFVAAAPSRQGHMMATAHALAVFGLAAEEGLRSCAVPGPGSLRVSLLDQLHLLKQEQVVSGIRISVHMG